MPTYNVKQFFTFKKITPSSLQQDNLIQFSYHSKESEIHDRNPLVLVIEKQRDRFYGFNLHYNGLMLADLIDTENEKIDEFLMEQWLRKYPAKRKQLAGKEFSRSFVEKKDLKLFSQRIRKKDIEQFLLENRDESTFRCYLFKRMNAVSKLVYKIV